MQYPMDIRVACPLCRKSAQQCEGHEEFLLEKVFQKLHLNLKNTQMNQKLQKEKLIHDYLISSSETFPEDTLQWIDGWLQHRNKKASKPLEQSLLHQNIFFYHGDITELECDAIVNPANNQGLGCFVPDHQCLDNVIHSKCGPRLRNACQNILYYSLCEIPTGTCICSRAYNIFCKYVIHAVGPNAQPQVHIDNQVHVAPPIFIDRFVEPPVYKGIPAKVVAPEPAGYSHKIVDWKLFEKTYTSILILAENMKLESIAIPCISTGLYGYPKKESAEHAVQVVHNYLLSNPSHLKKVILVTFTQEDEKFYRNLLFS